jgi:hypothetical protein
MLLTPIIGILLFFLVWKFFDFAADIRNLYSSRDNLWKELQKFQQTSKHRHKELLQRIHKLERNHVKSRGSNETFKSYQEEAYRQGSVSDCEGFADIGKVQTTDRQG